MTADLTRAEIEAMAADIHASHPWHKAITQILRQLDAANAENIKLVRDYNVARDANDAANARADAAAGQMQVLLTALNDDDDLVGSKLEHCLRFRYRLTMRHHGITPDGVIEADLVRAFLIELKTHITLPLHEEPNNGNV